jgi:hypothetical protein
MKNIKINILNIIIINLVICGQISWAQNQKPKIDFRIKNPAIEKSRQLRKQLKYKGTDSMQDSSTPQAAQSPETSLDELINSLNQLQFKKEEKKSIIEPPAQAEPEKDSSPQTDNTKKDNQKNKQQPAPQPYEKKINELLANPDNIKNPMPVAEALYKMGYPKKAGTFYKYALENIIEDKEHPDRPWVLFQTANCLRTSEPNLSYKYYQMLMDDYPDSFWVSAAKSRQEMLAWYQDTATSQILKKYVTNPKIKKEINAYIKNLQKQTAEDKTDQKEDKPENEK